VALIVHRSGLLLTVQDAGRWGSQAEGVPVAGPMDSWSHRLANLALGNPPGAATLEATLVGPELELEQQTTVAVTGAVFVVEAAGRIFESPVVLDIEAGERIRFRDRVAGARAYIGVSGGIDVPPVLASRATDLRSRLGGVEGRPVRAGDRLPLGAQSSARRRAHATIPASRLPRYGAVTRLRVLPVAAAACERTSLLEHLATSTFVVSTRSDRMGYRLDGAPVPAVPRGDLTSMPTVTGLVQVPPTGGPILLMADRQTTGGYLPAAVVIAADLPLAGQLAPGDALRFAPCSHDEAAVALADMERVLAGMER
jgi:antagonist of KipI